MKVAQDGKVADVLAPTTENLDIEERKIEYLQKFIDVCKANNIGLVVSYSPYYGQTVPTSIRVIEQLVKKNGVVFLNYGDDERFQRFEYFQDASQKKSV